MAESIELDRNKETIKKCSRNIGTKIIDRINNITDPAVRSIFAYIIEETISDILFLSERLLEMEAVVEIMKPNSTIT